MDNVNYSVLNDYLTGKLDYRTRHDLEKQALSDPFLADALDGFSNSTKPVERELSLLQKSLEARIEQQHQNKNLYRFTWQRLSVAMAAAVIFTLAGILFWMKADRNKNIKSQTTVEVSLVVPGSNTSLTYPQSGWEAFSKYLNAGLKDVNGNTSKEIVLTFSLNKQTAKPENIKVTKSAGKKLDEKAVELLEAGPKWVDKTGKRVEVKIKVK